MFGLPHKIQTFLFFKSVGLGMVTGFAALFFRALRCAVPHRQAAVFAEDVCFCGFSALLLFYFLFTYNAGVPRGYLLAGDCAGFCLCWYCFRPAADRFAALPKNKRNNMKKKNKKKSEKTEKGLDFSN